MDYTQTYIGNDMSKLNTVLQTLVTNGIVGAVDYDSSGNYAVFKIYADAEKTTEVFRITQSAGYGGITYANTYTFMATASDSTQISSSPAIGNSSGVNYVYGYTFEYGYATANGIMISVACRGSDQSPYTSLWIMVAKNESGKPVFIWTNNANAQGKNVDQIKTNMNTEYIVASSDVTPLNAVSRTTPANKNQFVVSPFFSCCATEETSYTPDAGRSLAGNLSAFFIDSLAHIIVLNGVTYLTNGYWVLKIS